MIGLLLAALSLEPPLPGVRINKALRAAHSRRETDRLVAEGRVLVNGERAVAGANAQCLERDLHDERYLREDPNACRGPSAPSTVPAIRKSESVR